MRLSAMTWPFPFLVRLGWASAVRNPPLDGARGRAYLLRGNGIVFSRGMRRLCTRLRQAGFWAEDLRCVGDRWACRHLLADGRAGRLHGPVVFVGHSCGGRYSLHAARVLQTAGVSVDLIVCLDVALPPEVPANVKRAVHLFRTYRRLYPARPLRPAAGSSAIVENIDLDAADSPVVPRGLCHLNFTDSPAVQALVMKLVLETAGKADPSPSLGAMGESLR
jgi:hypothetical protein